MRPLDGTVGTRPALGVYFDPQGRIVPQAPGLTPPYPAAVHCAGATGGAPRRPTIASTRWQDADWKASSASWGSTPSSRPPTATSARRSTTRSASSRPTRSGLTPVVFIITGFFFFCTAATLRRGDRDVPGGGRLVELRAPRVQRVLVVLRRLGARCSPTSSRSRSRRSSSRTTSAGCSGRRCATRPGDIIAGCVVIAVLAAINVFGVKESTGINVPLAVVDFLTQLLLVLIGVVRSSSRRRCWSTTSTSASRRRGATSSSRSRSACSPTRASRRSRTWPRRPRTRRRRSRRRSTACGSPCSRSTSRCPRSRCRRCRSRRTPTASTRRCSA